MAANTSASGGSGSATVDFERPVDYITVSVAAGATVQLSLDEENYLPMGPGTHGFRVGPTSTVYINATGAWGLIGVQA